MFYSNKNDKMKKQTKRKIVLHTQPKQSGSSPSPKPQQALFQPITNRGRVRACDCDSSLCFVDVLF